MPVLKAVVVASLLWLSDVNAFAPNRPLARSFTSTKFVDNVSTFNNKAPKTSLFMSTRTQAKDLYQVLGVSRNADLREIKQAFRMMAKRYHPDSNPHDNTIEQFQEVNRAYEVLRNPDLRKSYDMFGFDGIGTSAASDAEEMENGKYSSNIPCDQHTHFRYYEEIQVDESGPYDYGTYDHSSRTHQPNAGGQTRSTFRTDIHEVNFGENYSGSNRSRTRSRGQSAPSDQDQLKQPFRGGCFVDFENIGMGDTSDTFFGRSANGARARTRGTSVPSDQTGPKEPFRGGCFVDVNNIGMGETSHSFFGDIDQNGKPRGARTKSQTKQSAARSTPPDSFFGNYREAHPHGGNQPIQSGIFGGPADNAHSHSFFGDVVDGKPRGARNQARGPTASKNQSRSHFTNHVDMQSPSATGFNGFPSGHSESFFSANGAASGNRGSTGGSRVPRVGGDIHVDLDIDSMTAQYGGEGRVIITRFEEYNGQGLKRVPREITVVIPAGSKNGSMIRMAGEGDVGQNGGPSGDLYVCVRANQSVGQSYPEKTLKVEIPTDLNEEEQALLNKLRDLLESRKQNEKNMRP